MDKLIMGKLIMGKLAGVNVELHNHKSSRTTVIKLWCGMVSLVIPRYLNQDSCNQQDGLVVRPNASLHDVQHYWGRWR